jgi:hypothetical protein
MHFLHQQQQPAAAHCSNTQHQLANLGECRIERCRAGSLTLFQGRLAATDTVHSDDSSDDPSRHMSVQGVV